MSSHDFFFLLEEMLQMTDTSVWQKGMRLKVEFPVKYTDA